LEAIALREVVCGSGCLGALALRDVCGSDAHLFCMPFVIVVVVVTVFMLGPLTASEERTNAEGGEGDT
jgi:hypothetical protein